MNWAKTTLQRHFWRMSDHLVGAHVMDSTVDIIKNLCVKTLPKVVNLKTEHLKHLLKMTFDCIIHDSKWGWVSFN